MSDSEPHRRLVAQCSVCNDDVNSNKNNCLLCMEWDDGTIQPICADCRMKRLAALGPYVAPDSWLRNQFRWRVKLSFERIADEPVSATPSPAAVVSSSSSSSQRTGDGKHSDRTYGSDSAKTKSKSPKDKKK